MASGFGYLTNCCAFTWWGGGCRMLWPSFLLILLSGGMTLGMTPLIHMANFCSKSIHINDSLLLDLTEDLPADRVSVGYLTCVTTVHAPKGARLMAHVLQLSVCDDPETPDRLHIFDVAMSGLERRLTPSTGLYGVLDRPFLIYNTAGVVVPDFKSYGPQMRFNYQGKPTVIYRGFRVLVTVFTEPDESGSCARDTLYCPYAGTCVPLHVRCDRLPNCGLNDNQDERNCEREDVVTNLIEEYSTRTAVIVGVTGSLVFLGCAALVAVVIFKYNRHKNYGGPLPGVHYSARGGGTCRVKDDEEDLTRLYAPPSYEDIMAPGSTAHQHQGPPPAYHTLAAIHAKKGYDSSDEESVRMSRGYRGNKGRKPPHSAQEGHPTTLELKRMRTTDSEEDVRMHGTWPSDTDEEEEVRERRRRKGGKCKGKLRKGSQGGSVSESYSSGQVTEEDKKQKGARSPECRGIRSPSSPASAEEADLSPYSLIAPSTRMSGGRRGAKWASSPSSKSESESSPCQECAQHEECTCSDVITSRDVNGGYEVVSETESQLANSKRNSRTESKSRSESSSSLRSGSPVESSDAATADKHRPIKNRDNITGNSNHPIENGDSRTGGSDSPIQNGDSAAIVSDSPVKICDSKPSTVHTPDKQIHGDGKIQDGERVCNDSSFVDLNPPSDKNKPASVKQNGENTTVDIGATLVAPC